MVGTVDWNKTDYETLAHEFEWTDTPSTLAIVMAQEDLWVYEALRRVISRTNGKTTYANAAVKQINALEIGQNAAKAWRAAENSILATSASAPPGASASPPSAGGPPGPGGNAAADEERNRQQLMTERYVDDKGKPVPYMRDYPFAKHPCDEFKRMPIHLSFLMDQRRLPRLLVECANSTMPIEVQQVRISRGTGKADTESASAGSAGHAGAPRCRREATTRAVRLRATIERSKSSA